MFELILGFSIGFLVGIAGRNGIGENPSPTGPSLRPPNPPINSIPPDER